MNNIDNKIFQKAFEFHQNKQFDSAEKLYLDIIGKDSKNSEVLNLLGVLKLQTKLLDEAEKYILKALELNPNILFLNDLGKIYLAKKEYPKAIEAFKTVLEYKHDSYDAMFNLALSYKNNKNWNEAKKTYKNVIELNPKSEDAYCNLAFLEFNDNNAKAAVQCYEKVLELNPDDIESKYFLSLAQMQTKDYKNGLKNFENRLCRKSAILSQEKTYPNILKKAPLWKGEDISDKIMYVYYEAGFGDFIMFSRYLALLQQKCKKIILKPQKELAELFQQNFPDIEVMKYFSDERDIDFDVHLPILSLPLVLGLNNEEIFINHDRYLQANPKKIYEYKKNYFDNDKFKIGIKWQGNTYYETDRVIKAEDFTKLFDIPYTKFYSAQTFEGSEELNKLKDKYDIFDLGATFNDFSDTAAAVENLDLVICNDTSLAHLAGAMNKPCLVMLPHVYNWRWHTDLTHCDWYDSVKIFRQQYQGDWESVFNEIHHYLTKLVN